MSALLVSSLFLLLAVSAPVLAEDEHAKTCYVQSYDLTNKDWNDMGARCVVKMREQINKEVRASMEYLALGAYFSRDIVNRPGFAHFFFEAASEERQHAKQLIAYLQMRGNLGTGVDKDVLKTLITLPEIAVEERTTVKALEHALNLESSVTNSIKEVIRVCQNDKWAGNSRQTEDYNLVDFLSGDFLEEQYKGQRDLAGKITTLSKLLRDNTKGQLGEFLYDKKLLNGGLFK